MAQPAARVIPVFFALANQWVSLSPGAEPAALRTVSLTLSRQTIGPLRSLGIEQPSPILTAPSTLYHLERLYE